MGKIRGTHSSPGIYTQLTDISYAANTLGITTLGLVGETIKGPAFEPIPIKNWADFYNTFGGTSAELFKDSKYPKYELPYIAKSYLKASDQLYVCRVLGLSGYKAGSAFVITASGEGENSPKQVIAVLRSRGKYRKYANLGDACNPISVYDTLEFDCDEVVLSAYTSLVITRECESGETTTNITGTTEGYEVNPINLGRFTIVCKKNGTEVGRYPVSLNPGAKDYIYNVIGSNPTNGSAAVFVEELYDVMLESEILEKNITKIDSAITKFNELIINTVTDPVRGFVTIPETELKRKNVGQTFVYAAKYVESTDLESAYTYHNVVDDVIESDINEMEEGACYQVKKYVDENGFKSYVYVPAKGKTVSGDTIIEVNAQVGQIQEGTTADTIDAVYNLEYDAFIGLDESGNTMFLSDMCDYHESYRCASTPWIVSELKGDAKNVQVKKLFRFHTITDGDFANQQVKVSVANIKPDEGTFDIYVRDFNDSDSNPVILESYKNVTMVPQSPKYIGLQIGTLDGAYELKSKYVMVEIIENDMTAQCVPAGFLGYPVRDYSSKELTAPTFKYNLYYDEDIKEKRQYFGLSDLMGIDVDMLNYKGKNAYTDEYTHGYTNPFHLDSTLSKDIQKALNINVTIDGVKDTSGLTWDAVSPNNVVPNESKAPIIATEEEMEGTIYEDVKLRKFTVCFYGGFDGWDIYRKARTNTNEYKANKYKGTILNGHGDTFSKLNKPELMSLTGNCITSDYYAYLAGISQFENPEKVIINLFATPGIDYVNNELLVKDAVEMIENRMDTFYVLTTPDKPWGASDATDEMYSSAEAAANLEDSAVDTYYAGTYYPWVKYFDKDNNIYINLPATKDALRIMANVDNKRFPWVAPAGVERGGVECTKMHFFAKLEDRDNTYDGRINPLISFPEGVKIWGNKSMYICDSTDPMNRINSVRLMLYMRKLIIESSRGLIFENNDATLKDEFESIIVPILRQIKSDRGITEFQIKTSQTKEQMDAHELSCTIWVKPTPTLEYIEIDFVVTPQGVEFL